MSNFLYGPDKTVRIIQPDILNPNEREWFGERAAIMDYVGGIMVSV